MENFALPDPQKLAEKYGLTAKKALGQNFLFDLSITRKIVSYCPNLAEVNVVEIGPGPGGLTRAIAEQQPQTLTCIEFDERAVKSLAEFGEHAKIVQADAMRLDLAEIAPAPRAVIANLPYNIGTKLLTDWLENAQDFSFLCLMFQREVAQRIVAEPNSDAYGRLAIFCQMRAECEILFELPPEAFTPAPKVSSAVIMLRPLKNPPQVDTKKFDQLIAAAFNQRRKMLRVALKNVLPNPEKTLTEANINPQSRAQELSIADYVKLSKTLY